MQARAACGSGVHLQSNLPERIARRLAKPSPNRNGWWRLRQSTVAASRFTWDRKVRSLNCRASPPAIEGAQNEASMPGSHRGPGIADVLRRRRQMLRLQSEAAPGASPGRPAKKPHFPCGSGFRFNQPAKRPQLRDRYLPLPITAAGDGHRGARSMASPPGAQPGASALTAQAAADDFINAEQLGAAAQSSPPCA